MQPDWPGGGIIRDPGEGQGELDVIDIPTLVGEDESIAGGALVAEEVQPHVLPAVPPAEDGRPRGQGFGALGYDVRVATFRDQDFPGSAIDGDLEQSPVPGDLGKAPVGLGVHPVPEAQMRVIGKIEGGGLEEGVEVVAVRTAIGTPALPGCVTPDRVIAVGREVPLIAVAESPGVMCPARRALLHVVAEEIADVQEARSQLGQGSRALEGEGEVAGHRREDRPTTALRAPRRLPNPDSGP